MSAMLERLERAVRRATIEHIATETGYSPAALTAFATGDTSRGFEITVPPSPPTLIRVTIERIAP